jgi:hypothetical protein
MGSEIDHSETARVRAMLFNAYQTTPQRKNPICLLHHNLRIHDGRSQRDTLRLPSVQLWGRYRTHGRGARLEEGTSGNNDSTDILD